METSERNTHADVKKDGGTMQVTMSKETLMLALSRAQGIVGKKSTMPILSNILIESLSSDRLTVTATDLDIFAKGEYDAIIENDGRFCLNARDLHEIVRALPAGNVQIESVDDKSVRVTSGQIQFKLPTTSVDDYPSMPTFGDVEYTAMDPAVLGDLIDHTAFSIANDDPRIFLNGVNLERLEDGKLRMVSTDGHRLSLVDREVGDAPELEKAVIIPRKGIVELRKLLDEGGDSVDVAFTASNGFFKREDLLVVMRLIEGEFPDYNMVVPKASEKTVVLPRSAFADALKRMSIVSADRSSGVRFIAQPNSLTIESSDPEKGEGREALEAAYDGPEIKIGFNARYFLDAVQVVKGENVALELTDELSPCVVRDNDDDGFLCVVMPVRIN